MIVVCMCEHQDVHPPDTMTREGLSQHRRILAGIHEHRASGVAHDDRVALADVEHGHAGLVRRPWPQCEGDGRDHQRRNGSTR